MKLKLTKQGILLSLLIIISIFPAYCHIAGHMFSSIVLVPLLLFLCCFFSLKFSIAKSYELLFFGVWGLFKAFLYCYHGDMFKAISFVFLLFSIVIIVFNYISSEEKFAQIINCLIYVSTVLCLFGIVEGITGFNLFLFLDDGGTVSRNLARLGIIRIIGFTAQASHYALYMSMMAFLTIYKISIEKKRKAKRKLKLILILQTINVIFTLTRSTIICFAACILIILLKQGLSKFFRIVASLTIIGLILAVFFETSFLGQFVYMMLALVVPSFADKLAAGALSEYANGVADRFNLYAWVYESIKDYILMGVGEKTQFAYTHKIDIGLYSYYETKRSIEVYPLYLIYHFGIVGMVTELIMYLSYTIKTFKSGLKKKLVFENELNFSFIVFVILIMNFVNWFAVAQGEESTILYIIMAIWACYNRLCRTSKSAMLIN